MKLSVAERKEEATEKESGLICIQRRGRNRETPPRHWIYMTQLEISAYKADFEKDVYPITKG